MAEPHLFAIGSFLIVSSPSLLGTISCRSQLLGIVSISLLTGFIDCHLKYKPELPRAKCAVRSIHDLVDLISTSGFFLKSNKQTAMQGHAT
jgi:hypothetical protein